MLWHESRRHLVREIDDYLSEMHAYAPPVHGGLRQAPAYRLVEPRGQALVTQLRPGHQALPNSDALGEILIRVGSCGPFAFSVGQRQLETHLLGRLKELAHRLVDLGGTWLHLSRELIRAQCRQHHEPGAAPAQLRKSAGIESFRGRQEALKVIQPHHDLPIRAARIEQIAARDYVERPAARTRRDENRFRQHTQRRFERGAGLACLRRADHHDEVRATDSGPQQLVTIPGHIRVEPVPAPAIRVPVIRNVYGSTSATARCRPVSPIPNSSRSSI